MKSTSSLPPILTERPASTMDHFSAKQNGSRYVWRVFPAKSQAPKSSSTRRDGVAIRFSGHTSAPKATRRSVHTGMAQQYNAQASLPFTTTFRESYRGLPGTPAVSKRPPPFLPAPYKVGQTSYSADFYAKSNSQRLTPPIAKKGNKLAMYPSNVLYPYQQPQQVITVWKPFPASPREVDDKERTTKILARLSRDNYVTSYQLSNSRTYGTATEGAR